MEAVADKQSLISQGWGRDNDLQAVYKDKVDEEWVEVNVCRFKKVRKKLSSGDPCRVALTFAKKFSSGTMSHRLWRLLWR